MSVTEWFGTRVLILWMLLGWSSPSRGARPHEPRVMYTVDLTDARTQTAHVSMRLRGVETDTLDVCLPVWRPGRYAVLDPAGSVRWLSATAADGRSLACSKTDKSNWRVDTRGTDELTVDYVIYANSIADRTRHVDESHAFLSPATTFVYSPTFRAFPAEVTMVLPEGWRVSCGLPSAPGNPARLLAIDYDRLVDSPIEAGRHDVFNFEVEGIAHEIVVWWGDGPDGARRSQAGKWYNGERLTADFAKIVNEERKVFGDLPYDRYVFMVHAYPGGGGGTEHWNSTIMQVSPAAFESETSYHRFLSLVAHEFFHTWNVKRLRPAGLRPYDYQHENYTDLLWVAEGMTEYFESLTLARSGLFTPESVLDTFAAGISSSRNKPGWSVQSVEESSFDSWIKFSKASPDSVNSQVSFYDKGSMASFLLDLEIRERSQGHGSLDDLIGDLYRRFPETGRGYTRADVVASASRLAGSDMAGFFDQYMSGLIPYPFASKVGVLGLELAGSTASKARDSAGTNGALTDDSGAVAGDNAAYLGINLDSADPPSVTAVLSDGPAYEAGLIAGDSVLAANGLRLRAGVWDRLVKSLAPGDRVRLAVFRYDVLREIEVVCGSKSSGRLKLRRVSDPTDAQRAEYESWLRQPWPSGGKVRRGGPGTDTGGTEQ